MTRQAKDYGGFWPHIERMRLKDAIAAQQQANERALQGLGAMKARGRVFGRLTLERALRGGEARLRGLIFEARRGK